ncbi:hypothetical protein C8J56DRAFT_923810 [Mycena floridula]|nr:hypothetical protein C8J56DRAFT_923810 [Mycena floridula]
MKQSDSPRSILALLAILIPTTFTLFHVFNEGRNPSPQIVQQPVFLFAYFNVSLVNNEALYPALTPLSSEDAIAARARQLSEARSASKALPLLTNLENFHHKSNTEQMDALVKYLEQNNTDSDLQPPKVILATYWYFILSVDHRGTSGEVIWLESVIEVLRKRNYFFIISPYTSLMETYSSLGSLVTHVWAEDQHVVWCINDTIGCLESPENLHGIPVWKIFAVSFWGSTPGSGYWSAPEETWSFNPLGNEWNLMPEKHFYLGYHYTGCEDSPVVPLAKRKDQIIILAKRSEYFLDIYDLEFWENLTASVGDMKFISMAKEEEGHPVPPNLVQVGQVERKEYDAILGSSKALLGIGRPMLSPSPYAALVPFIVKYISTECPANPGKNQWCAYTTRGGHQHGAAAMLGPPYVYTIDTVAPFNETLKTIMTAVNTPIDRYVPPEMTKDALEQRIVDYFSIDWKSYAQFKMDQIGWTEVQTQSWMNLWLEGHPVPQMRIP